MNHSISESKSRRRYFSLNEKWVLTLGLQVSHRDPEKIWSLYRASFVNLTDVRKATDDVSRTNHSWLSRLGTDLFDPTIFEHNILTNTQNGGKNTSRFQNLNKEITSMFRYRSLKNCSRIMVQETNKSNNSSHVRLLMIYWMLYWKQ